MILEGKVAIVTGGTRGIGRAIALALSRQSVKVMICALEEEQVKNAVLEMTRLSGGNLSGIQCDVRSLPDVTRLVQTTVKHFGGVDILINNAGIARLGNIAQLSPQDWQEVIDTNLTGVFYCCHEVIPEMKRRGEGDIINIASRSGINAYEGGAAYNASKFGLIGLSEAMFLDLQKHHIRVSYVMPGRVGTEFAGEEPKPWHLAPEDVASVVLTMLTMDPRGAISRVELRPTKFQTESVST